MKNCKLWYDAPAKDWNTALPLGNGRMGEILHALMSALEECVWRSLPLT